MNNRNWIAVFLGLACLVLFVSVMGASGNWLNSNSGKNNGNVTPQQINQTIKGMETPPSGNVSTKIDASNITSQVSENVQNMENNISKISVPQMKQ